MPIAEKEFVLNYTMNRWRLNFKRNVGPTSASIRDCQPASLEEWETIITVIFAQESILKALESGCIIILQRPYLVKKDFIRSYWKALLRTIASNICIIS